MSQADRAKRAGKLVPVRLDDPFDEGRLPLGHDRRQIPHLGSWSGDAADPAWVRLLDEIEMLATPSGVLHRIEAKAAELRTERLLRQQAEAREAALEAEVGHLVAAEAARAKEVRELNAKLERQVNATKAGSFPPKQLAGVNNILQRHPEVSKREPSMEDILASIGAMLAEEPKKS